MLATPRRPRPARSTRPTALALALAGALVALPGGAAAAAVDTTGACADPDGVTVVVDATELGGDVTVACAPDPATGTEALAQAGFAEARDPSGFICAIGGLPDPCPTEFTGSYWTYWSGTADGGWTSYTEGSDTAVPAPGSVEGWRWGDGTQPPGVEPADVAPGTGTGSGAGAGDEADDEAPSAEAPADEAAPEETVGATPAPVADDDPGALPLGAAVAAGVAILGALVVVLLRQRRQTADGAQGTGQD